MRHRNALHEEKLARGAVRIALHNHRAVLQMGDQPGGDVQVVLEEVALRDLRVLPEDLVDVGELDAARAKRKLNVVALARNSNAQAKACGRSSRAAHPCGMMIAGGPWT